MEVKNIIFGLMYTALFFFFLVGGWYAGEPKKYKKVYWITLIVLLIVWIAGLISLFISF